jgi:hypothetical protein
LLIKYKKFFGTFRILLGILYLAYPLSEYLKLSESSDKQKWVFAIFFFVLYSFSAIKNGFKEIKDELPSFDLLRFFEIAMNGFISIYLLIVTVATRPSAFTFIFLIILAVLLALSMLRDLRLFSLQYYIRKKESIDKKD